MRPIAARIILIGLLPLTACAAEPAPSSSSRLLDGDILFQSLPHGPVVDAIEGCTGSPYSHCGIAHETEGRWMVIEAIGPVREIPLAQWIHQSRDGHFTAYRFRKPYQKYIPAIISATHIYYGRPYDIEYEFDDEKIYCSELIFKAFRTVTGEEAGHIQRLGDLNWKPWQALIEKINGGPVPVDRPMITPRALSEAPQLERVGTDLEH